MGENPEVTGKTKEEYEKDTAEHVVFAIAE